MTAIRPPASVRIPTAAWRRALGEPFTEAGGPRVTEPMIDDGAWGGVPIGGFGAGSIGRTHGGDFARWHLRIGTHHFHAAPACQFSVFVERADGSRQSHVLSTLRPDTLGGWTWDLPVGAGTYHGLFPRAWIEYDWERLPIRLVQSQLAPIIPGNYRETSYPLGLFGWHIENLTDEPLRVGLMLTWQALDEDGAATPMGATGATRREPGLAGVVLDNGRDIDGDPAGQFAVVAAEEEGSLVTVRSRFAIDDGADLWADFAADGALDELDDPRPSGRGEAMGGAVAVTVDVPPDGTVAARFAVAWDFPLMRFGSGATWYRRYTRFFGRDGQNAWTIAREALQRHAEWDAAIESWQQPLLDDPERPDWYVMALLNELYVLVDGATAWEDGRPGEPSPPEGQGRFCFLECIDYQFYNTHDVLFYASWAVLELWPELERRMMRSLIENVLCADGRAVTILATGEHAVRKEPGAVPHDLGSPDEDPWLQTNAYHFQDPNRWKDLNSKFVLQLWRDIRFLPDAGLIDTAWPSVVAALDRLAATDADGDGLPDHDGRADQTFDTWPMNGPSAYAGGLWLAALAAAEKMAVMVGDADAGVRYGALRARGIRSYRTRLWAGDYLLYDGSAGPHSDSIMADQLCGIWYADATDLSPYLASDDVDAALRTVVEANVRGYRSGSMGAVNGMRPDGTVDCSSEQSQEVWPGVTYALAASLLQRGFPDEAWETARGAVRTTYERGFWFRTPEAWDSDGRFRASLYMRPLSIWAIEHAIHRSR